MTYRIVPQAFVANGCLYGPGKYDFGFGEHNAWIAGNTLPADDATASLPDSLIELITPERGVDGAMRGLAVRLGYHGPLPITLAAIS
jgi:hypothetical protein